MGQILIIKKNMNTLLAVAYVSLSKASRHFDSSILNPNEKHAAVTAPNRLLFYFQNIQTELRLSLE